MPSLFKKILNFSAILIIAIIGFILAERLVLPYLAHSSPFNKIFWLKQIKERMTIVNKTEKIIVTEDTAVEEAIDKIKPAVVGVITKKSVGSSAKIEQVVAEGTGFILTADGLIVTANHLLPVFKSPEQAKYYIVKDEKLISAQAVKRDTLNNLALLRIQESSLPVVSLGNIAELRLGQRIILIGVEIQKNIVSKFVNWGIIRSLSVEQADTDKFSINLEKEVWMISGGPLFNIKAEVVGLIFLDAQGLIKIISVNKIQDLLK